MNRKYWISGLIGCILLGIGDWLLGYVEPGIVSSELPGTILVGHTAGFALPRVAWTMLLDLAGIPFYLMAEIHHGELANDENWKRILSVSQAMWIAGAIVLHMAVSMWIGSFVILVERSGIDAATEFVAAQRAMMLPAMMVDYILLGISYLTLAIAILGNHTRFTRRDALFSPLFVTAVIALVCRVLPAGKLTQGLGTFCMNGGMMVWYLFLMKAAAKPAEAQKKNRF